MRNDEENEDNMPDITADAEGPHQHGSTSFVDGAIVERTFYAQKKFIKNPEPTQKFKMLKTSKFELISKPEHLVKSPRKNA